MDFRAYYYTGVASLMKLDVSYGFKKSYESLEELEELIIKSKRKRHFDEQIVIIQFGDAKYKSKIIKVI